MVTVATRTLLFRFELADLTPVRGVLEFMCPPIRVPVDDVQIVGSVPVTLDPATGAGSVTLIVTDSEDTEPTNFTYQVVEHLHNAVGRVYDIALPAGSGPLQLADVAPASPLLGDYLLVEGPPGPNGLSAYEVAVINGFVGSESAWLASLVGPPGAPGGGGAVDSVNGRTGTVVLTAADVGAAPAPVQFTQAVASASWTIAHGLPYSPDVDVFDNAGAQIIANSSYPSPTQVRVDFAFPMTGSAVLH